MDKAISEIKEVADALIIYAVIAGNDKAGQRINLMVEKLKTAVEILEKHQDNLSVQV